MDFMTQISGALLFAPAGRAEIIPKAARADMVILDLEDGAGDINRETAYENIIGSGLDPARAIVRIVGPESPHFAADVAMVQASQFNLVMLPKVQGDLPEELTGLDIIAMIETPAAVVNIAKIASDPKVIGLFWGAEDLTTFMGGTYSRFQTDEPNAGYRDAIRLTRALTLIHAAANGKFAIDAIHADFHDDEGLYVEALDAARSGFAATACIHPRQVDIVRRAYLPESAQLEWAQRVVAAAAQHPGAFQLDGQMIDAPLVAQAEKIISRQPA